MPVTVNEIDPATLKKWMDQGEVLLIDVRENLEYTEEHIPKAQLFPGSKFDPKKIPETVGKKIVFYCQLGSRATKASHKWAASTGNREAFCLKGGLLGWKGAGLPTLADKEASLKIEKQACLWSGFLALLGIILGYFLSPWFLWLPVAVSLFLILSGIIGHSLLFYFTYYFLSFRDRW